MVSGAGKAIPSLVQVAEQDQGDIVEEIDETDETLQCFLSIPGLIYLTMVPMWTRAVRFANAYAFLAVDALYTIFWFSAFIAIAMWNSRGIKDGAKDKKVPEGEGNCTTFKWGSEAKCKLSRATFGFGVVVWYVSLPKQPARPMQFADMR